MGVYTVTVTAPGFKSSIVQDVKVDVGLPATVSGTNDPGGRLIEFQLRLNF